MGLSMLECLVEPAYPLVMDVTAIQECFGRLTKHAAGDGSEFKFDVIDSGQ